MSASGAQGKVLSYIVETGDRRDPPRQHGRGELHAKKEVAIHPAPQACRQEGTTGSPSPSQITVTLHRMEADAKQRIIDLDRSRLPEPVVDDERANARPELPLVVGIADRRGLACRRDQRHRALDDPVARARHYGAMARDALELFPASPWKRALIDVVDFCTARSH